MSEERQRVLRMLKDGKVTVEEAEALLEALGEAVEAEPGGAAPEPGARPAAESGVTPPDGAGEGAAGKRSGAPPGDLRTEFQRMLDDIMKSVDVDGIMGTVRESLRRSKVDVDRVKEEVLRARDRVRDESRRAAREYRRHGWGRISRTIEGLWGLTPAAGVWSHETDLEAGRRLTVHNLWGDVRVKPSPDRRMRATAVIRAWGRDQAEAAAVRDAVRITTDGGAGGVTLRVEPLGDDRPRRVRVDIDLQLPVDVAVEVTQTRGDVTAAGLRGEFNAVVAAGDVAVRDHEGPVRIESVKGDVAVTRAVGDVRVKGKRGDASLSAIGGAASVQVLHGDIVISGAQGAIEAHTMHGDVHLAGVGGRVRAGSTHGDIALETPAGPVHFDLETAHGDVQADVEQFVAGTTSRMSTMSGDLEVRLAEHAGCALTARVTAGTIASRAALTERQDDRYSLRGVHGTGDAALEMATVHGDITIHGTPVGAGTGVAPAG